MKKVIVFLALFYAVISLPSQTITPHFTERSKEVILPKDASVQPEIRDGLITVYYGYGNLAYLNTKGEYLFGSNFPISAINAFNNGYPSGGAAMVNHKISGDKRAYCIIYPDGKYLDLPDYAFVSPFVEGYALAVKGKTVWDQKLIYLDAQGREVFPRLASKYSGIYSPKEVSPLRENRRVFYNGDLQKYGYADRNGQIVIQAQFDKALPFSEGLAAVQKELNGSKKWGFIDLNGKMAVEPRFVNAPGKFSEGAAAVRIGPNDYDYEMAYIDKTGKKISPSYVRANTFSGGFAYVMKADFRLFVIDREFNEVRELTNEGGDFINFQFVESRTPDLWGFDFPGGTQAINSNGRGAGDIRKPDGTITLSGVSKNQRLLLENPTEGELIFTRFRTDDPRIKEKNSQVPCFMNKEGEIILYFQEGYEGHEGPAPVKK